MIKTTLDFLIESAQRSNKYDESETVAYVKSKRLGITTTNEPSALTTDTEIDVDTGEVVVHASIVELDKLVEETITAMPTQIDETTQIMTDDIHDVSQLNDNI